MGTLFRIVTWTTDVPQAREALTAAFALASEVEAQASDYRTDSALNQLVLGPINTPQTVPPLLFDLLSHAQTIASKTKGLCDPTLGPLTHLWRHSHRTQTLPDEATLASARLRCGWQHLQLDPGQLTITLTKPNMQLDLGGFAKGYAADLMLDQLTQAGFPCSMIVAGGDIRLGEPPPGKDGWEVALRQAASTPILSRRLSHCAVSTSGSLHQNFTLAGRSYSHIVDPTTGLGQSPPAAATVIAPTGRLSDPLATAACLHPDDRWLIDCFPGIEIIRP